MSLLSVINYRRAATWLYTMIWRYLPYIVFNILVIEYIDDIVFADGMYYFDRCLKSPALGSITMESLVCFHHPSLGFMLPFAVLQYLFPFSMVALHAPVFVLGNLAIYAFEQIAKIVYPHASSETPVRLLTTIYATNPVTVANMITFNTDIGVLAFLLIFLWLLLSKKLYWASAAAFMLIFTKETGIAFYLLGIGIYALLFIIRTRMSRADEWRTWKQSTVLLLPLVAMGVYVALRTWVWKWQMFFTENADTGLLHMMVRFDLFDKRFLIYLSNILVLNFNWIASAIVAAAVALWIIKKLCITHEHEHGWRRIVQRIGHAHAQQEFIVILFLYLAGIYLLTRFVPYNNPRYFLVLYPLGMLVLPQCLAYLVQKRVVHISVLTVLCILNIISLFRTVDPLSKKIYGTFPFGSHDILAMSVAAGETCCGYGRDQIIYNLEHQHLMNAQEAAWELIRPTAETVIVKTPLASFGFDDGIDPVTHSRSWSAAGIIIPHYSEPGTVHTTYPAATEIWYIEYPNFNNEEDMRTLLRTYEIEHTYYVGGSHKMPVHKMAKR